MTGVFITHACALVNANALDRLTITPYGLVPASRVIAVTPNEYIGTSPEGNVILRDIKTDSIIREYPKVPTKNLTFPFDSHGHAKNLRESDVSYPGYTVEADAEGILSFSTTWIVPEKPTNPRPDVTFFIWNGINGGALQPVLQWGNGSARYQIANWAYVKGHYIHGTYLPVSPGDKLTGIIMFNKKDKEGWHYTESFVNYPKADLHAIRDTEAKGVIQCFGSYTTNLDEIPASLCTKMKNIYLIKKSKLPSNLNWKVDGGTPLPTPSRKNTVIVNDSSMNGEIDFYFH